MHTISFLLFGVLFIRMSSKKPSFLLSSSSSYLKNQNYDVYFGRGKIGTKLPGNVKYKELLYENCEAYNSTESRYERDMIAENIVTTMKKNFQSKFWVMKREPTGGRLDHSTCKQELDSSSTNDTNNTCLDYNKDRFRTISCAPTNTADNNNKSSTKIHATTRTGGGGAGSPTRTKITLSRPPRDDGDITTTFQEENLSDSKIDRMSCTRETIDEENDSVSRHQATTTRRITNDDTSTIIGAGVQRPQQEDECTTSPLATNTTTPTKVDSSSFYEHPPGMNDREWIELRLRSKILRKIKQGLRDLYHRMKKETGGDSTGNSKSSSAHKAPDHAAKDTKTINHGEAHK